MHNVSASDRLLHFLTMVDESFPQVLTEFIQLKSTDLKHCQLISGQMARRLFDDWVDLGYFDRQDTSTPNRPQFTYTLSSKGRGWYERQTVMGKWVASAHIRRDLAQRIQGDKGKLDQGIVLSLTPQQKKLL